MAFYMWLILASLLHISVSANRYEAGPQKIYDVSFDPETAEQNENGEVILYLSPDQVKALEAEGALVRSAEDPENDEADSEQSAEPQVNEDQEEDEQAENEDAQEEEDQQEEQENPVNTQNQDLDFDEILRILNEEQLAEAEAEAAAEEQARNEPQVEEENTESPRNFSPRITLGQQQQQQQQEERYLAPTLAKKEQVLKSYSVIRYQPNDQRQNNVQLLQQQQELAEQSSEKPQTETLNQEKRKYKLIPYEVVETPAQEENAEEQAQDAEAQDDGQRQNDLITPLNNADRFIGADQRRNRLQSILNELRASSKYNDQKYAIEIERLRANAEKQIAASRAETIAKTVPTLVKQQLNKKNRLNKSKQGKGPARNAESQKSKQAKVQKIAPSANTRPIGVPVKTAERAQRPIPVPVEGGKRLSVRNVYVRARADKPYIVTRLSRRVPDRRNPAVSTNEPERITVLRHIWEN